MNMLIARPDKSIGFECYDRLRLVFLYVLLDGIRVYPSSLLLSSLLKMAPGLFIYRQNN